jgi:hypothetical protein
MGAEGGGGWKSLLEGSPTLPWDSDSVSATALSYVIVSYQSAAAGFAAPHCKKMLPIFPSPGRMSLTKLSLAGNILIIPGQGEFGQ